VNTLPGRLDLGVSHRYQRHKPENTPLYPIVEQHRPALRDELQHHESSVPRFVLAEFQDYLRCGRLQYGFVRMKCNGCRHEHLVASSCKRRGFCPSCGARRMIETSAHLVDHALPELPARQWVLSFPWPLSLLFAVRRPGGRTRALPLGHRPCHPDRPRPPGGAQRWPDPTRYPSRSPPIRTASP